jgi:hypothetical protein
MEYIISHIGLISGLISLCAYGLYIYSIYAGETKPSRSTWWILTLVGGLILWSSYALGAHENLWIQLSYVIGPLIVAFLSLRHGDGAGLSRLDISCLCGAGLSALFWIIFNSPLIGLLGSILVDFLGLIPTIRKSYTTPEEESPNAWLIETVASALNMLAISSWFTFLHKDWIYALYLFGVNGLIAILLWRRRIARLVIK